MTLSRRAAFGLVVVVVFACNDRRDGTRDSSATPGDTLRVSALQAELGHVTIDSLITIEPGLPPTGKTYEGALAGNVLRDESPTAAVFLSPSDTGETANYQAAAWWLGYNGNSLRERSRFAVYFARFASGVLVLKLDTLYVRDQEQPPFHTARADSIAVRGLRETERLATRCRISGYQPDDRVVGLTPDSSSELWMKPRRAWFIDTVASRFRRMSPDALACWLAPDPD